MELAKNLQQALDSHRRQLSKHVKIWKKIQDQHAQDLEIVAAAESCQKRTEQMIQQCSSIDFLRIANVNGNTNSKKQKRSMEAEDIPKPKRTRRVSNSSDGSLDDPSASHNGHHIPVTKDPSGLFLIDSNPDVDLLHQVSRGGNKQHKKQKRGRESDTEKEYVELPPEPESSEEDLPTPKRKKAKHGGPVQESPKSEEAEHLREIEQKVVLRLKEKEETSKKKANKKRKRESDVSVGEPQVEVGERTKPPPSKKRKDKAAAPTAAPTAAKQPDQSNGEEAAKRKKRNRPTKDLRDDPSQPKSKKKKAKGSS